MWKWTRLAALLALTANVVGCGASPAGPTPPPKPQVTGRLLDYQTHAGIGGVVLEWYGAQGPYVDGSSVQFDGRVTTDTTGSYSISLTSPGLYVVSVGQLSFADTIYFPGGLYRTDLFQGSSDCPVMFGVVWDATTSRPVAGATITWVASAATQTDGSYFVDVGCRSNYGSGTSAIGVTHSAYKPQGQFGPRLEGLTLGGFRRLDFALTPR